MALIATEPSMEATSVPTTSPYARDKHAPASLA
jgi:hypothetical protein